jgi:hypothetical protein
VTTNQIQLGSFIAEMVDGTQKGIGRLATPTLKTDWSKVVERLMSITYGRVFHHKPALKATNAQRGVTAVACLALKTGHEPPLAAWLRGGDSPPFGGVEIAEVDGTPIGISIFHVQISDRDLERVG